MLRRRLRYPGALPVAVVATAVLVAFGGAATAQGGTTPNGAPPSQFTHQHGSFRPAKGSPVQPSGTEVVLWGPTSSAATAITGSGRIMIGAIGTYCEGWPTISVSADGQTLGTATVVSATNYDSYRIGQASTAALPAGTHSVTITYINDFSNGTCDRNVAIGWAKMENPDTSTFRFTHPGVDMTREQLADIKARIDNKEPLASAAFSAMASSSDRFARLTYTPKPVDVVRCPTGDNLKYLLAHPNFAEPKQGCDEQVNDAIAAETQALMYSFTGNRAYARKSIEIMNAWSHTLKAIPFDMPRNPETGGQLFNNGILQAVWTGETITRAAEIIRYTYTPEAGETPFDVAAFSRMLTDVLLPLAQDAQTACCSNWATSAADATIKIGIFTDSVPTYLKGVSDWRNQVPSAFYLTTDVPTWPQLAGSPIPAPGGNLDKATTTPADMLSHWQGATSYVDGLAQETCRDLGHMSLGFEAAAFGAESARIQGIDLFGEQKTRFTKTLEYNASLTTSLDAGNPRPANGYCPDRIESDGTHTPGLTDGGNAYHLGWELGYTAYATRMGASLPETRALITRLRPMNIPRTGLQIDWQTLLYGSEL